MEDKQQTSTGRKCCTGDCARAAAPFILGLVVAMVFGWWLFPSLLYSQKEQSVAFTHKTHLEQDLTCSDCHVLRTDGSFAGLPDQSACNDCHASAIGESKAEAAFVADYVEKGRKVEWLVHQKQPDNVFFSHVAHATQVCQSCHPDFPEEQLCSFCHLSTEALDQNPAFQKNRLTGYSKLTMKMWQCERCHAIPGHQKYTKSNNACYTCHK